MSNQDFVDRVALEAFSFCSQSKKLSRRLQSVRLAPSEPSVTWRLVCATSSNFAWR